MSSMGVVGAPWERKIVGSAIWSISLRLEMPVSRKMMPRCEICQNLGDGRIPRICTLALEYHDDSCCRITQSASSSASPGENRRRFANRATIGRKACGVLTSIRRTIRPPRTSRLPLAERCAWQPEASTGDFPTGAGRTVSSRFSCEPMAAAKASCRLLVKMGTT
jgi:hypothetical protein